MDVEFFGLPGSGKSTIAKLVAMRLASRGVPAVELTLRSNADAAVSKRMATKTRIGGAAVLREPLLAFRIGTAILCSRQDCKVDGLRRAMNWLVVQGLLGSRGRGSRVRILDEGVGQALWSVGLRGDETFVLRRLAVTRGRWLGPDVLVVITTPPGTALGRLERRQSSHSRIQKVDGERRRLAELHAGQGLVEELLAWWRKQPTAPEILAIANSAADSPAAVADAISSEIARYLQEGAVPRRGDIVQLKPQAARGVP